VKTMADAVHWADVIAERLLKENGKHLAATGIIPSGSINISNVREAVTADAVYK
jgi:lysyl-tRNA synthetase class 1